MGSGKLFEFANVGVIRQWNYQALTVSIYLSIYSYYAMPVKQNRYLHKNLVSGYGYQ